MKLTNLCLALICTVLVPNAFAYQEQKLKIHKANERGNTKISWLDSRHTFSFGEFYDPKRMGFGVLRVINDDVVTPGAGFATHSHKDMEIISYVLEGELAHKDSMGNGSTIRPGDVQRMSAGSGVTHSEYNALQDKPSHFLQIWVLPKFLNIQPSYEQKTFSKESRNGKFVLVVSGDKNENALFINQDFNMYVGSLQNAQQNLSFNVQDDRRVWVQLASGAVELNGEKLSAGDGVEIQGPLTLNFSNGNSAEIIVFEMA